MSADFDKFLKLEKRLFKLIDDPLSEGPTTSRKIMGKKERIRNKMRKLEPKIKGMKDGGLAEAIEKVKAKEMESGGSVGDKLREEVSKLRRGKAGGSISMKEMDRIMRKVGIDSGVFEKPVKKEEGGDVPKPKMRPKKDPFRADKTVILNEEFSKAVAKANERAMKKAKKMEAGGEVPAKFKGFSKLPESVQEKMNPSLAKKFDMGGSVKGKGNKMMCRGRGAAIKGGGFSIR